MNTQLNSVGVGLVVNCCFQLGLTAFFFCIRKILSKVRLISAIQRCGTPFLLKKKNQVFDWAKLQTYFQQNATNRCTYEKIQIRPQNRSSAAVISRSRPVRLLNPPHVEAVCKGLVIRLTLSIYCVLDVIRFGEVHTPAGPPKLVI